MSIQPLMHINEINISVFKDPANNKMIIPHHDKWNWDCSSISKLKFRLFVPQHSKISKAATNILKVFHSINSVAHNVFEYIHDIFSIGLNSLSPFLKRAKVIEILLVPFIIDDFVKDIFHYIHGNRSQKMDAILNVTSDLGSLGSSITNFAIGLTAVGILSKTAIKWITPLYIISSVLSVATIASHFRTVAKMKHLKRNFDNKGHLRNNQETTLDEFRQTIDFIKKKQAVENDLIKDVFEVEDHVFMEALARLENQAIEKSASPDSQIDSNGRQILNKTLKSISDRFHHINVSSVLGALSSAVSLIGAIILLVSPITAPVAYGMIGLSGVISLGAFVYKKVKDYHFNHELGIKKKWFQWISS